MDVDQLKLGKAMVKYILIIAMIVTNFKFATGVLYSTCYEYETYCLFSFGPNVTVNNVKEAQKICEDAKHGSWLLEISDERVLKSLDEFFYRHFFPADAKFILNAEMVKNSWRWIRDGTVINGKTDEMLRDNGEVKYYKDQLKKGQHKEGENNFIIICMADCRSTFEERENMSIRYGTRAKGFNQSQCREKCEVSDCDAWKWVYEEGNKSGCWIHNKSIVLEVPMNTHSLRTLYLINRTVKKTDNCLGMITDPDSNVCNLSELNLVLVHLIPLVLLTAVLLVVTFVLWRKYKNRQINQEIQFNRTAKTKANVPVAKEIAENQYVFAESEPPKAERNLEIEYIKVDILPNRSVNRLSSLMSMTCVLC